MMVIKGVQQENIDGLKQKTFMPCSQMFQYMLTIVAFFAEAIMQRSKDTTASIQTTTKAQIGTVCTIVMGVSRIFAAFSRTSCRVSLASFPLPTSAAAALAIRAVRVRAMPVRFSKMEEITLHKSTLI
mmetsp:Transcript_75471/g.125836  ORF Transcript_75471/g.125836 Transcript_75471/m.125836 type:complete len:128 (+) Transcript_75471:311-694(+)